MIRKKKKERFYRIFIMYICSLVNRNEDISLGCNLMYYIKARQAKVRLANALVTISCHLNDRTGIIPFVFIGRYPDVSFVTPFTRSLYLYSRSFLFLDLVT